MCGVCVWGVGGVGGAQGGIHERGLSLEIHEVLTFCIPFTLTYLVDINF